MTKKNSLTHLEDILNYHFNQKSLLSTALTHRSSLNENKHPESNERLEFLGDAVLELVVSHYLYTHKSEEPEGILTANRSAIVRTESLAIIAKQLNLGDHLIMSKGEEATGGRENRSLLANTLEAVIGAIYLDSNFQTATQFITLHLLSQIDKILQITPIKDNKSHLQELVQKKGYPSPAYQQISATGPDHNKIFIVAVNVNGRQLATGSGRNKQEAEQEAAQKAIALV